MEGSTSQNQQKNSKSWAGFEIINERFNAFVNALGNFIISSEDIIGIDIGSGYIKLVQLQKKRHRYQINKCITRALPQAVRENPQEKKKLVQQFVKEFVSEIHTNSCLGRLVIYGKGVFVFSLTVPNVSKKDLRGAVGIELKKRLPFQTELSAVTFDFFITGQTEDEKGITLQVTCVAALKALVEEGIQLLKDAGIRPVAICVLPDALGNLIPFCFDSPSKKTQLLLEIGAGTSLLNFYKGRNLVFCREIPIGGDHFTHALSKTLNLPEGTLTISLEDAEKIKRNCGLPLQDEAKVEYLTDLGRLRGEQLSALLRPTLERFVMELNRTFSYYTKTFRAELSDELYLTGGGSRLKNLDKFLLFNLEGIQKVEPLNILGRLKGWTEAGLLKQELMMEQAMPHLAAAFSVCLGTGGRVNLLPVKERVEQKALVLSMALRLAMPLLLIVTFSFYLLLFATAKKYARFNQHLEQELSQLQQTTALVKEYLSLKTKIEERQRFLDSLKPRQPYWLGLLKELSNIVPAHVTLDKIIFVTEQGKKELHLYGKIFAKYSMVDLELSQFQLALEESPYFKKVDILPGEKDMYSAVEAKTFKAICQLIY
ncbi:MAG: pilus assembly protein PilM [Candidatus Omnitrophica bacterium]|nr:pilus assembly protein PilM [Candidatus Omnitrophota bacterium]